MLPFTPEQFLDVFKQYNLAVWPMPIVLYLMAALSLFLTLARTKHSDKIISGILAFFWIWMGLVYHLIFFAAINKAAYVFGIFFILQGTLFLISGFKGKLSFSYKTDAGRIIGAIFMSYGLVIYPILNYMFGHPYPYSPTFGLPCPTTIFTFGLLLWTSKKVPKYILIISLLWSFIGVSAAVNLGIWEDVMLAIAGVFGTTLIVWRDRKK